MHASRYNIVADGPHDEKLLYNTANAAFASLDAEAFEVYAHPNAASSSSILTELIEYGFLTHISPSEELAIQQQRFDAARADHAVFSIAFGMTYACNYRCPYCYEQGLQGDGRMSDETIEDICAFVEECYERNAFTSLWVEWYGGDPSLALDRVEELSRRLIAWCDEHGIDYDAMILTNCLLIDRNAVDMLKSCRVSEALLTIDGPEEVHNRRRVAADGSNSYAKNIEAARLFREAGIRVSAGMNVDRNTIALYPALRDRLREELNIDLSMNRLCDYGGFYGTRNFKAPEFDLLTHEEFCQLRHDQFVQDGFSAGTLRAMLRPVSRFCRGQLEDYYVIDCHGDVYSCDGYMGQAEHRKFNLEDMDYGSHLHEVTHDATRDVQCGNCELLPICQGNCTWERHLTGMPCHPLRYTINFYLNDYRACYGNESLCGFTLLAPPMTEEELVS